MSTAADRRAAESRNADPVFRGGSTQPSLDLRDLARTFVKHRWWALLGFVLLAAPVAIYTLVSIPVYQATTRLLVAEAPQQTVALGPGAAPDARNAAVDAGTLVEVVRSRGIARDVAAALRLWESPEFAPLAAGATSDAERAQRLVDALLARLTVEMVANSQVLTISFEASDPAVAARATNQFATRYVERERESRFDAASSASDWLSKRLAEQREAVASAETALQQYRAKRDALSLSDRQNIVVQKLADLNSSVTRAKTDRILRETQYQQLQAAAGDPAALESLPAVAGNAGVQALKAQLAQLARQDAELANRLGPKHPDRVLVATAIDTVQGRVRAEVERVVSGVEAEYQAAVTQEVSLTTALNQQKSEAFALDQKGVEYAALEREAVSARQVFDALLQQTKQASLLNGAGTAMRVVDAAEPPGTPVRPLRRRGLAAAAALGLLGAVGGAMGREFLRGKVISPRDIEQHLGLQVLAIVPPIDGEVAGTTELDPLPAEAFRRLRACVLMGCSAREGSGRVLVVTSAAPDEGKTFVTSQLALALAAAHERVALIDGDLRRPRLHSVFDKPRQPGLSDVLLGARTATDVLIATGHPGLSLMPAGAGQSAAGELLPRQTFKNLIAELRLTFDWVLIDSPPVMAAADAGVLAREASAVVFVTCADQTTLESADAALADLAAVDAPVLGAVLNRAPITREAFYYSRYYRADYAAYLSDAEPARAGDLLGRP